MTYTLILPSHFDEHGWEIEAKGWFVASVEVDGLMIELVFYDPARLKQEIEDELSKSPAFFEKNIVVVSTVNRQSIESAVQGLYESGRLAG
jgi:hypothetical protein